MSSTETTLDDSDARPSAGWLVLGAFVVLGLGVLVLVLALRPGREVGTGRVPVLGKVPAFRLVDQEAKERQLNDFLGAPWVADFIFTECVSACPLMTREMARLQDALASDAALADVRLVSFSVDPKRDTPEKLAGFAERFGARTSVWKFLTGKEGDVADLCERGFRLASGGAGSQLHSDRFILVDGRGRIRGYYRPTADEADREKLLSDLRQVVSEPARDGGETAP